MSRSRWHVAALVLGAALYAFGAVVPHGYAQVATTIRPDGTLGTSVTQSGNLYGINGGTIKGNNQFHSFDRFSVGTGDIASFNGPAGIQNIQNIVSRVTGLLTGPAVSQIDGTIASTISGANLFLLNPAGIMFGPNAQLNISGSFHATTADYIKLGNDGIFYADPAQATVLSVAPPSAFGFLTSNPAPIDVQAGVFDFDFGFTNVLQVPAGKTLSFVGGPINIGAAPEALAGGFVLAPGGRINLVSVASPGEARFDGTGFSVDTFARLGDISIKGNSVIDGKEVFIRGGRLVLEEANIQPGFFFQFGVSGDPPNGGEVNIQVSDSVNIKGPPSTFGFSGILAFVGDPSFTSDVPHISIKSPSLSVSEGALVLTTRQGPGNPGNISIEADTVEVRSGAQVAVLNTFQGPGGTLTVNARDVTLDSAGAGSDQFTGLTAQAFFHSLYAQPDFETGSFATAFLPSLQFADSGSITVNATGKLTMRGSAQISTDNFAFGKSGNITINAGDMLLVGAGTNTGAIAAQSRLAGQAGGVTINATGSIDMQNGFRISANTLGSDDAGQVNVRAGRSITMTGASTFISSVTDQPLDDALKGFAQLFAPFFGVDPETFDYPSLRTALGVAPATGDLMNVLAALSTISDGAGNPLVAITDFTPGNGGKVSITAPVLAANDGAHIETSTLWNGNAGAIEVNVGSLTLRDGAIIGSRSGAVRLDRGFTVGTGNAGTVDIAATGAVEISGRLPTSGEGSVITTNTFGDGNAGNISLSANQIYVQNGGSVSSASGGTVNGQLFAGTGNAGQITVSTPTLTMGDGGTISVATSGAGAAGEVTLNLGNFSVTGGAQVVSSTTGAGQGGNVTVAATGPVSISGSGSPPSGLFSTASSTGNAGEITVSTPTLTMADGGTISVATEGDGAAGNISLNVSSLNLTGGAQVVSSTTSAGAGGGIAVAATGSVAISGSGSPPSGLFSTASSTGNAGQITVSTPTLTMGDGGTISVNTAGAGNAGTISLNVANFTQAGSSRVDSSTSGAGQGGDLTVMAANSALISGPGTGLFSTASGSGAGGNITIQAGQIVLLTNEGTLSAQSTGTATATAGNININTPTFQSQNGSVTTGATLADGGNISITTSASLLRLTDSQITTSVQSGVGQGGNITIGEVGHPFEFILLNRSQIRADAFGGPGGNINIFADVYLTSASVVSASSALSTPGTIAIEATVTDVSGSLTQLPTTPLEAVALMRASCAARLAGGKTSSLVVAGREGLPLDPSGLLPSPLVVEAPVAALALDEEFPWVRSLLWVSYLSLDPNCMR